MANTTGQTNAAANVPVVREGQRGAWDILGGDRAGVWVSRLTQHGDHHGGEELSVNIIAYGSDGRRVFARHLRGEVVVDLNLLKWLGETPAYVEPVRGDADPVYRAIVEAQRAVARHEAVEAGN